MPKRMYLSDILGDGFEQHCIAPDGSIVAFRCGTHGRDFLLTCEYLGKPRKRLIPGDAVLRAVRCDPGPWGLDLQRLVEGEMFVIFEDAHREQLPPTTPAVDGWRGCGGQR